jgi:hypothetical protein
LRTRSWVPAISFGRAYTELQVLKTRGFLGDSRQPARSQLTAVLAPVRQSLPSKRATNLARRARRRERSGAPGFTIAAWVASHVRECTELIVEGDRGFESLYPSRRLLAGRHGRLVGGLTLVARM